MDDARTSIASQRRAPRWRFRWLLPGVPAVVLAILTINVLTSGPLVRMDQRVWSAVRSWSQSPGWHWAGGSRFAPAELVIDLADPHVAVLVLLLVALPSGHTTTATVCYVLAALLLAPRLPAAGRRWLLAALPAWCLVVGAAL